ncbi:MAG: hypothetical protein P9M15_02540 [Candidatus Electryoneaceae bacterium]|nr:hypothetical protein [Candidatus Electryoneaceae bacterium]
MSFSEPMDTTSTMLREYLADPSHSIFDAGSRFHIRVDDNRLRWLSDTVLRMVMISPDTIPAIYNCIPISRDDDPPELDLSRSLPRYAFSSSNGIPSISRGEVDSVGFSFVPDGDTGRPSIDPELMVKDQRINCLSMWVRDDTEGTEPSQRSGVSESGIRILGG